MLQPWHDALLQQFVERAMVCTSVSISLFMLFIAGWNCLCAQLQAESTYTVHASLQHASLNTW